MATRKQRQARRGILVDTTRHHELETPRKIQRLMDKAQRELEVLTKSAAKPYLGGMPGEDHMAEANALVNGDRQAAYGSPLQSYTAQAKVWSGMLADKLKEDLTAEDVVLLLTAMKLRRQAHKPKRDNVVDTHGYMLVLAHVEEGRKADTTSTRPRIETTDHR